MRRLGSLAAVLAVSMLATASPASAADAGRLAGKTTLVADSAGYVPIQLDAPLKLVLDSENRDEEVQVDVDGGGPVAGFVLRLDDSGVDAPGIMRLRTPAFDFPFVYSIGAVAEESSRSRYVVTLPAGRYRLFAIGAGKPVTVTLRLPGLEGVSKLRPTFSVPLVAADLDRLDPVPADNLAILGSSHALTSTGLVAFELLSDSLNGVAQKVEMCTYAPGADSTGSNAFGPGCPGGEAFSDLPTIGTSGYGLGTNFVAEKGEWGLGGNIEAASVLAGASGFGMWMSFDGTPIPGATIPDAVQAAGGASAPPSPAPASAVAPAATPTPATPSGTGGAPALEKAAAKKKPVRSRKRCPRVTRRSSRALRRRAARCRAAQRRAARRRA